MDLMESHMISIRNGIRIEWIAAVWMIVEAVIAVLAGVMAHSVALIAFGADSIIELVAGGALLWRLYVEANHANIERVETAEKTASWIVGIGLLLLALYIVVASIRSLLFREGPETAPLGIGITAASSILMPILAANKRSIGRRIGSRALESDGSCSMVCAYMSWIVLGGVLLTAFLGWWWIDVIAALGLVYFVVHEEILSIVVDGKSERFSGQAAASSTRSPFTNLIPASTRGMYLNPSNLRHPCSASLQSL